MALEGDAHALAVVVGQVAPPVLLLVDLDALGPQALAQRAEVQGLAVHEHAVEVEYDRAH